MNTTRTVSCKAASVCKQIGYRSLVQALKEHRHLRGELVLSQEDGALLTRDMIKRVLPRACRKAGLDRTVQWHALRHTFASHLVMRGSR